MVTAIYKNKSETLKFDVVPNQDATEFSLQVENIKTPLAPTLNATLLGLRLLVDDFDFERRIAYANAAIALLQPSDREELLDRRPGFRGLFTTGFATATWSQVQEFCEELNKVISARTGSEFSFEDFNIDLDLQ